MDVVVAGIAVFAFAFTVLVLVRAAGTSSARREPVRTVWDAEGEEWMTIEQTAAVLGVGSAEVMSLAERGGIPHYVVAGGDRSHPAAYRFRRDEIDAWTIG